MPTPELSPEQLNDWLTRGRQGDEAACAALFQHFSPNVLRLSIGLLGELADAEEATQDTFVYALSRLGNFDASRSAFSTWLYTIAVSRCRNKRRRKWLTSVPLEMLTTGQPMPAERQVEALLERRGIRRQVWQALQGLQPRLREAVALRYVGGLRYKEIGRVLGCNPKTAESRVRLGLGAMGKALQAHGVGAEVDVAENWTW
jgi:RNA polymerase sigma-70 factor, ECF subfamily